MGDACKAVGDDGHMPVSLRPDRAVRQPLRADFLKGKQARLAREKLIVPPARITILHCREGRAWAFFLVVGLILIPDRMKETSVVQICRALNDNPREAEVVTGQFPECKRRRQNPSLKRPESLVAPEQKCLGR